MRGSISEDNILITDIDLRRNLEISGVYINITKLFSKKNLILVDNVVIYSMINRPKLPNIVTAHYNLFKIN